MRLRPQSLSPAPTKISRLFWKVIKRPGPSSLSPFQSFDIFQDLALLGVQVAHLLLMIGVLRIVLQDMTTSVQRFIDLVHALLEFGASLRIPGRLTRVERVHAAIQFDLDLAFFGEQQRGMIVLEIQGSRMRA